MKLSPWHSYDGVDRMDSAGSNKPASQLHIAIYGVHTLYSMYIWPTRLQTSIQSIHTVAK